jgi:hypothetical protein
MQIKIILVYLMCKVRIRVTKFLFGRYNNLNYPQYIKNISKFKIILPNNNLKKNLHQTRCSKISYIDLATKKVSIKDKFSWLDFPKESFEDNEDFESLHRWKWIIKKISSNEINTENFNWFLNKVIQWHELYNDVENKKNNLIWESYNVSERICNLIISSKLLKIRIPDEIKLILDHHVNYLLNKLEFFGLNTGNHIINNSRALYLYGCYYNNKKLINIAEKILLQELPKLLNKEFMLHEGSTHYHFLLESWLLEIYYFLCESKIKVNKKIIKYIIKINNITNFFKQGMINFPKFGDISPDCSPSWINNIESSKFFNQHNNKIFNNSWNNLWNNQKIIKIKFKYIKINFFLKESGFLRVENKNQIIFLRTKPKTSLKNISIINHGHDDVGHFLYFYKKKPVIIDSGRFTYKTEIEKYSSFHNSMFTSSYFKNLNYIKFYLLNFLLLKTSVKIDKYEENFKITFYKGSKIFKKCFLNSLRIIHLKNNFFLLEDFLLNKSFDSSEIITFAKDVIIEKKNLYLDKNKRYKCHLGFAKNLSILNKKYNLKRYEVIKYGQRTKTKFLLKKFLKQKNNKFKLLLDWNN